MTTFAQLKAQCDALNGYLETGSNQTKIWAELQPDFQGQPYCAAGVSYLWKHAGHPFPTIDHAWGFSYCPDAVIWAKAHGLWSTSGHYSPGDTIFYDWNGHGVAEHTGIVISDDGINVHTFECNTSSSDSGSQSNGGGCFYRVRPHGPHIMGVLRSSTWFTVPAPAPKPQRQTNPYKLPHTPPYIQSGSTGDGVRYVQWAVRVPVDGKFGPQTVKAVKEFQLYRGIPADGIVGPQTVSRLMQMTK